MKVSIQKLSNIIIIIAIIVLASPYVTDKYDMYQADQVIRKRLEDADTDVYIEDTGDYILYIDSIDVHLPVNNGVTHDNMRSGVATMKNNVVVDGCNFAIAGHRNIRSGKNLNRLGEVEVGDYMVLYNNHYEYVFSVTDIDIVTPNRGDVIRDSGNTELTLVTCHPIGVSSHRLIVKGELIDEESSK